MGLGKGCIGDPEGGKHLASFLANGVSICFVAEVKGTAKGMSWSWLGWS